MKIQISGKHTLKTTPVFDTYWRFAARRQAVFLKRVAGHKPPWSDDPVLAHHRFTNTYRASDRVSQFLIREVAYKGLTEPNELFFRILLFKIFNKIETWSLLVDALGCITWDEFDIARCDTILENARTSRTSIYSAAYIMPSPKLGEVRKHSNHLRLLQKMMKDRLPEKIAAAKSLRSVYELLLSYPSMGRFLAFQLAIDLNYSQLINFSEMDFVAAGPGAKDGISKCFEDTDGLSDEDVIGVMAEIANEQFDRLGLDFSGLWGRPLQLIDCQNLFCEVGKYARVAHPEIPGHSGRTRIKQKFKAAARSLPQWYPPKWRLRIPEVSAPKAPKVSLGLQSRQSPVFA